MKYNPVKASFAVLLLAMAVLASCERMTSEDEDRNDNNSGDGQKTENLIRRITQYGPMGQRNDLLIEYDKMNRLIAVRESGDLICAYSYNNDGTVTVHVDDAVTTVRLDKAGRLSNVSSSVHGDSFVFDVASYDADGNPTFSDGWFRYSDGNTVYEKIFEDGSYYNSYAYGDEKDEMNLDVFHTFLSDTMEDFMPLLSVSGFHNRNLCTKITFHRDDETPSYIDISYHRDNEGRIDQIFFDGDLELSIGY